MEVIYKQRDQRMSISATTTNFTNALPVIQTLWQTHNLPANPLQQLSLTGDLPVLPSSFAVTAAAQASIAVAAAMASVIAYKRTGKYLHVAVNSIDAAMECTGAFKVNGVIPPQFAPLSGLYQTSDGYIRMHANFDHHRDIILNTVGLATGTNTSRAEAEEKIKTWETDELDQAIMQAGGACAALRTFEQWDSHPQANHLKQLPLIEITKIGDAEPRTLSKISTQDQPLTGIRALDLTRILAGPICGRTLAAYGAEVMLINSPHLPNIENIADTSRGKLSAHIDLQTTEGNKVLHSLIAASNVFVQGYRPGAIAALGFGPEEIATQYPGIIYTSLSAYGRSGAWSNRRGFDSLVQTATGFNSAEAQAFGSASPKAMPVQILDYASGFLMAFGTQVALHRQATEGGSYHVQVSLARTGQWLRSLGQSNQHLDIQSPDPDQYLHPYQSGFGDLQAIRLATKINSVTADGKRQSMPPGAHPPIWT